MAVSLQSSDAVLGIELGSQMSVVATGTRAEANGAVNKGGVADVFRVRHVPSTIAYAGKVR